MFAALLFTGCLATAVAQGPATKPASEGPDIPDLQQLREQFQAQSSVAAHVSASSEIVFQRGRFADGVQRGMRTLEYELRVEGNLTPPGPEEDTLRFDVIEARRVLQDGEQTIVAPRSVLHARWSDGYANLEVGDGTRLHGNDRMDLAHILGGDAPGAPTMIEIVNWPETAEVGDHWGIDVAAFQKRLEARGVRVQLHELGGEATLLDPGAEGDDEQPTLRVLLWADRIEFGRRFDNYTGRLEERHEYFVDPADSTPLRHAWTVEQSLTNIELNADIGRHVTNEVFTRNRTDLRMRPTKP